MFPLRFAFTLVLAGPFFVTRLTATDVNIAVVEDQFYEGASDSCGLNLMQLRAAQSQRRPRRFQTLSTAPRKEEMDVAAAAIDPEELEGELEVAEDEAEAEHLEDRLKEAKVEEKVEKMEEKLEREEAVAKVRHLEDLTEEAKLEEKVLKLEKDLEEAEEEEKIEKLSNEAEKAEEEVLQDELEVADDEEQVADLKDKLRDTEKKAEESEEKTSEKEVKTEDEIKRLSVELEKAKDSLKQKKLVDKLHESEEEQKVEKESAEVGAAKAREETEKLQDRIEESEAKEKSEKLKGEVEATEGNNVESSEASESDDSTLNFFTPTGLDNTDKTCNGQDPDWGERGSMSTAEKIQDCAELCLSKQECHFIQYQADIALCHMYKDCEVSRSCENACGRTLEREDVLETTTRAATTTHIAIGGELED